MKRKRVTIGLIGHGVVGGGTLQFLKKHRRDVESSIGAPLYLKWVCSRRKKKSPWLSPSVQQTTDWREVVNDPEVECVIELMGGTHPAKEVVMASLKAGKHVITANKAILSKYWNEIFETAWNNKRLVYFEAAVGGAVPVVQVLNEGMAGNDIRKIVGILNGTTNFILTRMQEDGLNYHQALKEAQKQGFAEANPAFDVNGIDAAQKISILGSLATGQWIPPSRVFCQGIAGLKPLDIRLVQEKLHSAIKLLGIAEKTAKGWQFRVHPALVPLHHPFANVRNEYNAIALHGDAADDVLLYGKGAGRFPTASAVISDLIYLARHIANGTAGQLPFVSTREHRVKIASPSDIRSRYYLRVNTLDKPGVLARITKIFGRHRVSIASVHQDTFDENGSRRPVPIVMLTHMTREADIQESVREIDRLPYIKAACVLLRME